MVDSRIKSQLNKHDAIAPINKQDTLASPVRKLRILLIRLGFRHDALYYSRYNGLNALENDTNFYLW